jgi:membrane-bound lytic murein transglycosylase B
MVRRSLLAAALVFASGLAQSQPANSFDAFLAALWPDAAKEGITRATFETAFAGVTPDAGVIAARRRQPEYGKPFGAYLSSLVSPGRISIGRRKAAQSAATLRAVQERFGVDPTILVSIWGIESSYGDGEDRWDVFRSLATLAQARFHHPFFRDELLSALKILQEGHIQRREFVGSWAGAMGQTQFMPSSFLRYAVDFNGDGKADIWHSVPDVLASIANYLEKTGWQRGVPWGFEVNVPPGFDYNVSRGTFAQWAKLGFTRADAGALPAAIGGTAILFFPSGAAGPAFLVTDNFIVLKRFNNSDAYAIAVGALSDRLSGFPPIHKAWPADDFQPSREQRIALQKKLAELGYKIGDFEGHLDFDLRDAVRDQQRRFGMIADGYPGRAFLDRVGVP